MILWGHNFLKSDWIKEAPLRAVANVLQMNRLCNIPKYIEGLGCRIFKDTTADGKNWMVVVDGTSDIQPPPGFDPPWDTDDQFVGFEAREPQDVIVLSSTYGGTMVDNTGDVQWPGTPPSPPLANLTPSDPFELEYDATNKLYAQHWFNPPYPYSNIGAYTGTDDPTGLASPPDTYQLIATIVTDRHGQIISFTQDYEKPDTGFNVSYTTPTPIIGFQIAGGVWQEQIGTVTTPYKPIDDDITWGAANTDHSWTLSRVYRGEGVVWAVFDKTASPSTFYFKVLDAGVDPTWADGENYIKILTATYEYETPGDDTTPVVKVDIDQHHQGGLHSGVPAEPKACASMTSTTTISATGLVSFSAVNHETNSSILDVDTANDKIIIKSGYSGIYSLKLMADLLLSLVDDPGYAEIEVRVRVDGTDLTECVATTAAATSTTYTSEAYEQEFSASIDLFIDASSVDKYLDVYATVIASGSDAAQCEQCRLDVHLVELTDSSGA